VSAGRRFRELLARPGIVRSCGVHDAFAARVMEDAGLEFAFLGGFGVSASLLGLPDVGLTTLTEMADAARRIVDRVRLPLVVDGDTGHGGPANVARTVREFERAGAAGMLIEDQVFPKRCGHFAGKQVVPLREMEVRLRAALEARRDPDFALFARTDARAVEGFEAAVERANRFAELGADVCFVEAPVTREEVVSLPRRVPAPLLANMLWGGATPLLSAAELEAAGYRIVVWPIESLQATATALRRVVRALLDAGTHVPLAADLASFAEIQRILGAKEFLREPGS
jgi:methylisocitrate lyase